MKFTFFSLLQFLFLFFCEGQVNIISCYTDKTKMDSSDVIYYNPNQKLCWPDFIGLPTEASPVGAITSSGFGYGSDIYTAGEKVDVNIFVYCYFNKSTSWVRKENQTNYILNHEQRHFDISYIASKLFIEKVLSTTFTKIDIKEKLEIIYKETIAVLHKLQADYDLETKNGQLSDIQEKWNSLLDSKVKS